MNVFKAILLKLASAVLFAIMQALVRWLGDTTAVGQVVFFRSAFAILPVVIIYAWRGELIGAIRTGRPLGHLGRGTVAIGGMFSNFAALARLPLLEATAIQFASPLITVAMAALVLKERVRIYRWSAVAIGFVGVLVMVAPHIDPAHFVMAASGAGALFALLSAFCNAGTVVQTRRLTQSETTSSIVFYFSLICALAGLCTAPFGWHSTSTAEMVALISIGILGGLAHIVLTESYRHASASVLAPFDYTSILFALGFGYILFGEVPTRFVLIGALIVTVAGLFVIWRERQLGLRRAREAEGPPAAT
jgi:drug/metabolite transporter (DMT)-like permease